MFFSMLFVSSYIESKEDWPDCSMLLCKQQQIVRVLDSLHSQCWP